MAGALEQVAWPTAASDSQGGLWLACRSFPTRDTLEPPDLTIQFATSWHGLRPVGITHGKPLSPPALAVSGDDTVYVAWVEGQSDGQTLWVVAVNKAMEKARARSPQTTSGAIVSSLAACTDMAGAVWLGWLETLERAATIHCTRLDADGWSTPITLSDPAMPASEPCLAADPNGGVWVGWTSRMGEGFAPVIRHITTGLALGSLIATGQGEHVDLLPSIAVDGQGRVFVAW